MQNNYKPKKQTQKKNQKNQKEIKKISVERKKPEFFFYMENQIHHLLKKSCNNAADLNQTLTHYHRSIIKPTLSSSPNRRCNVSFAQIRSDLKISEASEKITTTKLIVRSDNGGGNGSGSVTNFADRLRLGSLTEDGLSYKENFIVRCYEVGINKTATVETIANLLQENACNHAQSVGFSTDGFATTPTMRLLNLIWVTSRMHIEVYKYPAWGDVVEIETWCQGEGRLGTRRDWIIKDFATGAVIGRATSKWVMMNEKTRRPQRVSDEVREEYLIFCPRTPRLAFSEENNTSLKKIPVLEDPAQYSKLGLAPRRADLDMNQHVNNVTYIGWLLESIPQETIVTHELQKITLDYKIEIQQDDIVNSLATIEEEGVQAQHLGTNGSVLAHASEKESFQFLHSLRLAGSGVEINRGRTEWRRIQKR